MTNTDQELRKVDRRMREVLKSYGYAPNNDLIAQLIAANEPLTHSREQAAELRGRNQAWGFTYGYLHGWHKNVCHEWEEEYKEWEATLQAANPEKG